MWVRSKYASELAVICAWITVFIPWNITYHSRDWPIDIDSSIFLLRFPFVELQFRDGVEITEINGTAVGLDVTQFQERAYAGTEVSNQIFLTTPLQSGGFYDGLLAYASWLWLVASVAIAAAFAFSIVLYAREAWVTSRLPVTPVRLMGAMLGVGALGTGGATVLYFLEREAIGVPIPIGVVIIGLLAAVLLQTEEVEDPDDGAAANQSEEPSSS